MDESLWVGGKGKSAMATKVTHRCGYLLSVISEEDGWKNGWRAYSQMYDNTEKGSEILS